MSKELGPLQLSNADLREADLVAANLHRADLSNVRLLGSRAIKFSSDKSSSEVASSPFRLNSFPGYNKRTTPLLPLWHVLRTSAKLTGVSLREANLAGVDLSGANLYGVDLQDASLSGANLCRTTLNGLNLRGANLSEADLSEADLSEADLTDSDLYQARVVGTNFENAILTGACLEEWNVNSTTKLDGVVCDYIYLKSFQQERRPREGTFKPGEFTALFQQAVDTVDLIFKDGIDWQAFFQSFQDLRSQYADQDLSIQGIEKKRGGAFIVRLEVAEDADKKAIEISAKELYETQLKALEAQYERQLRLQGEQYSADIQRLIADERQEKATLMSVLTTMASNQGSTFDLRGAQIAGGVADTVQGSQYGGTINNAAAEMLSLAEAAAEIQNLLKQLEASNPAATQAEQIAFLNIMISPTRRDSFIGALKAASRAAIEEAPCGSVLNVLVEGWQKADV